MVYLRHHRAHHVSVGTLWNAAIAIGLLIGLWLPLLVQLH